MRQQLDKLIADALLADLDGDGVVTIEEARTSADAKATQGQAGAVWRIGQQIPMSLDADTDGAVSLAEFEGAIRREFNDADKDRDGRILSEEARVFGESMRSARQAAARLENERRQRAEAEAAARACSLAKPPADARIVVLGTYEGRALSNVSIGGDDRETTVANIEVAPGREPLFLVVTSYDAMVWRVWGATERVTGMFVSSLAADRASGRPRAGVVGLSREKIQFAPKAGCLRYFTQNDNERTATIRSAEILFGRTPADVSGIYAAESFKAPSGQHLTWTPAALNSIQLPETGPGAPMWKEMLRYNPAGLANIDPATVVSPLPVRRYAVLPQQAGLAQLLEEGALAAAATTRGVQTEGSKLTSFATPGTFLITRKTMFPAGLNGAHSVRFILARGVPMPDGDPGHSCVLEEDTGRPTQSRPGC